MAGSTCHWSPNHIVAKPIVLLLTDSRRYVYVDELSAEKKAQFLASAKKLNKKYFDLIENDEFVNALKKQFNASIVIEQKSFNRALDFKG